MGIYDAWERGRQSARDQQTRSGLAKFLQGDQSALPQVYANNPQAAMGAQTFMGQQQDAAEDRFGKLSGIYAQTKDPSVYQQIRPLAKQLLGADLPESLDDPADLDGSLKAATAWAQAYGGAQQQELRPHVVGNALVDATGKVLYQGESPEKWSLVQVPDGQGGTVQMEYSNGRWRQPTYGGAPQASAAPTGGASTVMDNAFVDEIGALVSPFGGRITSTVGGQHNPGSKHYTGDAIDIGMAQETPEQQSQIIAALEGKGYRVRDERTRPQGQSVWSGPHLHVERGGQGGPRLGYTPPKPAAQQKSPARQMTPQELQRAGFAPGTVAYMGADGLPKVMQRPPTKPTTDTKRQQEVQSQEADFQEIERLVNTLDRMNSVSGWSSTLMPFGEDRNTYQSTTGQLAVLLKPLIRKPGEGTWTDKDQELLERLVPKLDNYEGTNKAVIENIRSLIRSRRRGLGIGQQPAAQRPANGGFRILPD